jgi:hypothetical protein
MKILEVYQHSSTLVLIVKLLRQAFKWYYWHSDWNSLGENVSFLKFFSNTLSPKLKSKSYVTLSWLTHYPASGPKRIVPNFLRVPDFVEIIGNSQANMTIESGMRGRKRSKSMCERVFWHFGKCTSHFTRKSCARVACSRVECYSWSNPIHAQLSRAIQQCWFPAAPQPVKVRCQI